MKRILVVASVSAIVLLAVGAGSSMAVVPPAIRRPAPQAAPPPAEPTLEQRVADLEAYVNNAARVATASKIAGPARDTTVG